MECRLRQPPLLQMKGLFASKQPLAKKPTSAADSRELLKTQRVANQKILNDLRVIEQNELPIPKLYARNRSLRLSCGTKKRNRIRQELKGIWQAQIKEMIGLIKRLNLSLLYRSVNLFVIHVRLRAPFCSSKIYKFNCFRGFS